MMGKSQIKSLKSQIFFTGDLNIQAKSQILNRISHQNVESSNSKSQIKSQILKQQKGFSKHISIFHLTLKSQIFFTGDSNIHAKSQILNRISHQNLESSNSKSQIKSQILKQQKSFSKHISILLVPANGNHWNFHFRSSAFTCIDLAVQSLP